MDSRLPVDPFRTVAARLSPYESVTAPSVASRSQRIALATRQLLALGHRRILLVCDQ